MLERLDSISRIMGKELSNVSVMGGGDVMAVAAHNRVVGLELLVGNSYAAEDEYFTANIDELRGILKERAMLDAEIKDEQLHFKGINANYSGFIGLMPFEDVQVEMDENEELIDQFDTSSAKFQAISDAASGITLNRIPVTDNKNKFLPMYVAVEGGAMVCNCADKTHTGVFYREGVEDGSLRFSMDGMTLRRLLELEKGGGDLQTVSVGAKRIYVNSDSVNASLSLLHETDARAKDRALKSWRVNRMFLGFGDYVTNNGLSKEDVARAQVVIDSNDVKRIVGNIKELRSDSDDGILIILEFDAEGINFEYNSKRSAVAEYINRSESYESLIDGDAITEISINPDVAKDISRLLPEDDIQFCLSSYEEDGKVKKRLLMSTVERETKKKENEEAESALMWIQAGLA